MPRLCCAPLGMTAAMAPTRDAPTTGTFPTPHHPCDLAVTLDSRLRGNGGAMRGMTGIGGGWMRRRRAAQYQVCVSGSDAMLTLGDAKGSESCGVSRISSG